jgi:hypothetical protein
VALVLLVAARRGGIAILRRNGSSLAALGLFAYAVTFSFAYLSLKVGVGALILFAAVQITMISVAMGPALAFGD